MNHEVEQISVFLENSRARWRRSRELEGCRDQHPDLTLATRRFGILRMIVNDVERHPHPEGKRLPVSRTARGVEVPTTRRTPRNPRALAGSGSMSIHVCVRRTERQNAVIIFRFDDPDRAIATLSRMV